jgi:hypothetical protein
MEVLGSGSRSSRAWDENLLLDQAISGDHLPGPDEEEGQAPPGLFVAVRGLERALDSEPSHLVRS